MSSSLRSSYYMRNVMKLMKCCPYLLIQISTLQDFFLFFQKPKDCACQGTRLILVPLLGERGQMGVRVKVYYLIVIEQQAKCKYKLNDRAKI